MPIHLVISSKLVAYAQTPPFHFYLASSPRGHDGGQFPSFPSCAKTKIMSQVIYAHE